MHANEILFLGDEMRNLRPREIFFLITVPQILIMWKVRYPLQMQGSGVWRSWQTYQSEESLFG